MSDNENQDIPMAECGACRAIIPLDSESCSSCGIRFGGVSEESLGECGACGKLQPVDSEKCIGCGVSFTGEEPEADNEVAPAEVHDDSTGDVEVTELDNETEVSEENDTEEAIDEVDEVSDEVIQDEETEEDATIESDSSDSEDGSEEDTAAESEVEEGTDLPDDSDDEAAIELDSGDSEDSSEDETVADSEVETVADSEDEEEVDLQDDSEEATEDEDLANMDYWRTTVVMAFENLALAIAESGMTASEAFIAVDGNDDNLIDAPELQKGIEEISGEWLTSPQVTAILEYLDTNENNRVDPHELVKALDDLKIGIKPGKMPKAKKAKEFPSTVQKFLMGKSASDIYYPIAYFLMVTFIGIWVVNGAGLLVDGTGGTVVYEGHSDSAGEVDFANWNICESGMDIIPDPCFGLVLKGESYPCDPAIDTGECANSLTLFSGDNGASSMPAGFYTDGIIMITLGIIGLVAIAYLHLIYAPSLRNKVKDGTDTTSDEGSNTSSNEEDQSESPLYKLGVAASENDMSIREIFETMDTNDDGRIDGPELQKGIEEISGDMLSSSEVMELLDTLDKDSNGCIDPMELVRAIESLELDISSDNNDSTDEEDSDDEDSEDEDSEDEDDIDVGDWVGIEIKGKEIFGEIIEFDDDEGTVTIETEDGDEITGDQDDMFLAEDDDE